MGLLTQNEAQINGHGRQQDAWTLEHTQVMSESSQEPGGHVGTMLLSLLIIIIIESFYLYFKAFAPVCRAKILISINRRW